MLSRGRMKTADGCNQKPPANPVVFAVSIFGWITVVQYPPSLFGLPPEWNETPEDAFSGRQFLNDHFEASFLGDGHEFIVGHRNQKFFPSPMATAAFPFVRVCSRPWTV